MRIAVLGLLLGMCTAVVIGCDRQPKNDGETLYMNYCSRCHGADGTGGTEVGSDVSKSIQGKSVQDIRNAIYGGEQADGTTIPSVEAMKSLQEANFTDGQLQAISDYLYALLTTASLSSEPVIQGLVLTGDPAQSLVVSVSDARRVATSTVTDANGRYRLATGGLTLPLLLQAHAADGRILTSVALASGNADISLLTDFVVYNSGAAAVRQSAACSAAACAASFNQQSLSQGQRVFAYHFARRLQQAGINPADFTPFDHTGDRAYVELLRGLIADRVTGCGNPFNPQGLVYDDDDNRDCYHDNDANFDGYGDDDIDGDGLPG